MEVTSPDDAAAPTGGSAVTIGAYDGVHLGHRYLLDELARRAAERSLTTVVVTFDRHPATVVRPESAPPQLTSLDQKLELLAAQGVDRTVVIPFDATRAEEPAEDFVQEVLVRALDARLVVVGEDFHFGHGRKGNVALLAEMGRDAGFDVVGVGLKADAADAVSSTRIRSLVARGQVEEAAALLGRPYEVRGVVRRGDGRGGPELGVPTANVDVPAGILVPGDGIYAGRYRDAAGQSHPAAISVGRRPTFYEHAATSLVEAHLIDFHGDLYDQPAAVSFLHWLHPERRYDSVEALIQHMHADVERARQLVAS